MTWVTNFFKDHVFGGAQVDQRLYIHDIFLPDDYPEAWSWRGYNEQLGVLPLLLGQGWQVVFASHYTATRMSEEVATVLGDLPLSPGAKESSLWIRKRWSTWAPPITTK